MLIMTGNRLVMLMLVLLAFSAYIVADEELLLVEDELKDYYCTEQWPSPPTTGAAFWQRPTRPLILIPGIAGSMLHMPLNTTPATWKKLWVAFRTQDDVGLRYLSGIFNGSMVVERYAHQVVTRNDGFGLCSIDTLDPDLVVGEHKAYYYRNMILYLISLGYIPGETLFGFPYDWRQSVRHPATMERLHQLVTTLNTGSNSPVDIITHSMGGLIMKSYLDRHPSSAAGIIGRWTAIGTPWRGGGSVAYKAMISGYTLDMTTIPIVEWGLSEIVAHALELNWPSAFELMPDVDHDAWWSSAAQNAPQIRYQVVGQPAVVAESSADVKRSLQAINALNIQIFQPGTPAVPNPINMAAWRHADETRQIFAALPEKLNRVKASIMRQPDNSVKYADGDMEDESNINSKKRDWTLEINSIEGSKVPTKFSILFRQPVQREIDLQRATPQYTGVMGDGTVPFASARSDGLGARHWEYPGTASHVELLSTPSVWQTVRGALDKRCFLEGQWRVDIRAPNGVIFSTQNWTFHDESALVPMQSVLQSIQDEFNTTLPDGTPIQGLLSRDCLTFIGTWATTYRAEGRRILGNQCASHQPGISRIGNGQWVFQCIYGNWTRNPVLQCDEGYEANLMSCIPILPPPSKGKPSNVHWAVPLFGSIAGFSLLAVIIVLVVRYVKNRSKNTEYRQISLDDTESAPNDSLPATLELYDDRLN